MILAELLRLERPLIGLDLETTTANPKTARIVEIGLEIMRPGEPIKEWRTLINPGVPIPAEATAAHHITDEIVQSCALCRRDAEAHRLGEAVNEQGQQCTDFRPWPAFTPELATNLARGFTDTDFAGFHVHFDLEVMQLEMQRVGVAWSYEDAHVICGLRLKQVTSPRSLADVCKEEGIELLDAHSALADAKAATRCIASMVSRHAYLPRTVPALHDLLFGERYDSAGKLRWKDGELIIGFGKNKGERLRDMDRGWLGWVIRNDFSDKVKDACRLTLKGQPPTKEGLDGTSELS